MTDPIPLIADVPTASPGLGFSDYSSALADAIRGVQPAQFTVGLYGPWGSGKSSLLSAIATDLADDDQILVVEFDAWRHERSEHVVVPLLHAVMKGARARKPFHDVGTQVGRILKATLSSISLTAKFAGLDVKLSGGELIDGLSEESLTELDAAFSKPMDELKKVPGKLGSRRIVVLVDDLDRCSPDRVVSMLEAINLVMDIEGFVFVLALDYEVLVDAVAVKYPHLSSGHAFIEKIVQLPFRVPPLQIADFEAMRDVIPTWTQFVADHDTETTDILAGVAGLTLSGNPRQVKRLVNYVQLLDRIVVRRRLEVPASALVPMVALQLAWPEAYRELMIRVAAGDDDPLQPIRSSGSPTLERFAETYLTVFDSPALLTATLNLTSAVETPALTGGLSSETRPVFEGWLRSIGFAAISDVADPDRSEWRSAWSAAVMIVTTKDAVEVYDLDGEGKIIAKRSFSYDTRDLTATVRGKMARPDGQDHP